MSGDPNLRLAPFVYIIDGALYFQLLGAVRPQSTLTIKPANHVAYFINAWSDFQLSV